MKDILEKLIQKNCDLNDVNRRFFASQLHYNEKLLQDQDGFTLSVVEREENDGYFIISANNPITNELYYMKFIGEHEVWGDVDYTNSVDFILVQPLIVEIKSWIEA